MNRVTAFARAALLSLALALPVLAGPSSAAAGAQAAPARLYVCPACNAPCDKLTFDHAGVCPQCGMALIEQAAAQKAAAETPPAKKVAILVFNNVEIIDFSGPYEMFGAAGYDVYTVAATKDPIQTAMGLKLIPEYSFADAPAPDVLLVPGGGVKGACSSEPTLDWVKKSSAHSEHTLSVCNGAFILGQAGLLDGLAATTTAHLIDQLHDRFPKVNVVRDRRFVDNGKIVTAAGLSSGIDGALHVLSVMEGEGAAQQVALQQEYDWNPSSGYARAALADMVIPNVQLDSLGTWTIVSTAGDREHWDLVMKGTSKLSAGELRARIHGELVRSGTWSEAKDAGASDATHWAIASPDGRRWTATLTLAQPASAAKEYTVHLAIARAG